MSPPDIIAPDRELVDIAEYVERCRIDSALAYESARYCLIDSIGCAVEALRHPACLKLLGPIAPSPPLANGARVPGTSLQLDPATAAFDIGAMVRWLDFNDTFVALQTTHPSDDLGAILAVADHLSRSRLAADKTPLTIAAVLEAMIKAHEVQGVLGIANNLETLGIDHTLLVRVACAAVIAGLLGGGRDEIVNAVSLAFIGADLCIHRFGSNTGPRKGWAAAHAASEAVRLAWMAAKGEPGYPEVLSHAKYGFNRIFLRGGELKHTQPYGSHVMENVLFKIQCPVVIHAQSAIEAALRLHPFVRDRLDDIDGISITTHERTLRTIDKKGPLRNPADRDHCLQYAVAIALLRGRLTAEDYEDEVAADPRIDRLRTLMRVEESAEFTAAYRDTNRRANPNAMQIFFRDGTSTERVEVTYPIGHAARRTEGIPLLVAKFERHLAGRYGSRQRQAILDLCLSHDALLKTPVNEFTDVLAV